MLGSDDVKRVDFSSVIKILLSYRSLSESFSQGEFIAELFSAFYEKSDASADDGQVSRWVNGDERVPERYAVFYLENLGALCSDIRTNIFPVLSDRWQAVNEIRDLVLFDSGISENKKFELLCGLNSNNDYSCAEFIAKVLLFAMQRGISDLWKHSESASPVLSGMVFGCDVPKVCPHFCGRENELQELHDLLTGNGKVFVSGIAGMGKTELVKAYAKAHKKDYTNILFLNFRSSLAETITAPVFAGDGGLMTVSDRYSNHLRLLKTLSYSTLIIIDGFDTVAAEEPELAEIMRLRCRVLFTTRSSFENSAVLNLEELSEENALFLFSAFFTRAEMERETVTEIIRTIHSHTLAIELAARLLQRSFIKPSELLGKLKSGFGNPDTSDKIRFTKDGTAFSDTYHNHIRTLFALGNLCDEDKYVMRCLSFVPERGIDVRNFALMAQLATMNSINDLAEYGYIRSFETDDFTISLHPMIRDITVTDLQPTFTNCNRLMNSVKKICGFHGKLVPNFQLFADILDGIMTYIYADSPEFIPFAEDAFTYVFQHSTEALCEKILARIEACDSISNNDKALLCDFRAQILRIYKKDNRAALEQEKQALSLCANLDSPLYINLCNNLGSLYMENGDLYNAEKYINIGFALLEKRGVINQDYISGHLVKGWLLCRLDRIEEAAALLTKCCEILRENSALCSESSAICFENAAVLCQKKNRADYAEMLFRCAFDIFCALPNRELYEDEIARLRLVLE